MSKVRVAGAIANKTGVTLYLEDGTTRELKNDAYETKMILDQIMPRIVKNKIAEVDLTAYSAETAIEKQTNGLIRFFKKTGDAVAAIFKRQGVNDNKNSGYTVPVPKETTVAVVNNVEIPGVEKLAKQIDYAAKTGNVAGLQRFMERIAAVVEQRGHTVQELLAFIEKGDLPIADDGSIIAYKRLYKEKDGWFTDPHTRTVHQRVGSLVRMDLGDVDASRRVACSTGLHIGRRDYMRSFNGDAIMLCKIAPEDVIAVPVTETSKMRVAAYHILAQVNDASFDLLCRNEPITKNEEGATLLANVIKGNHVGVLETVEVSKRGGKADAKPPITIIPAEEPAVKPEEVKLDNVKAITVDEIEKPIAEAVSPKELNKKQDEMLKAAAAEKAEKKAVKSAAPKKKIRSLTTKDLGIEPAPADPKPAVATSDRDQKVIDLIKQGKSHRMVERLTGVSARSVRRILDKHGLRDK